MDQEMEGGNPPQRGGGTAGAGSCFRYQVIVLFVAAVIFGGCIFSPPSLMDDVDAVQAQIAHNMLQSGDWVTPRLDGVAYLEKSPLKYWMIAVSFLAFGIHDWAARIPIALSAILLCWTTARFGEWAFGQRTGMYAGLALATSVGLFLFTRILIPDVVLTLTITLAMWSLLRVLDEAEQRPTLWAMTMWGSMGTGLLLKGLIAAVFPIGSGLIYLMLTRQLLSANTWRRIRPLSGTLIFLLIAAPWHVLATLKNPPYFDFTMHSERGSYHGFFWFYFINEHLLRFLNLRYPRDYNTVPRVYFWLFHFVWLFPWSIYFPTVFKLRYRGTDRASRARLLLLCWCGFILIFFTFSTTQEYYSMPCYPAMALLLASAITSKHAWLEYGTRAGGLITAAAFATILAILCMVWKTPAPGDISAALNQHPEAYTLSLGHMTDLTLRAFAYLKVPLLLAGLAMLLGAVGAWKWRMVPAFTIMMILFFHAARLAMIVFDPYMSSKPLAEALLAAPPGKLILDDQYYTFSSVVFYTNRKVLLLNGRVNNLEYGSYAPDAPRDVFITDKDLPKLWSSSERYYLVAERPQVNRIKALVGGSLVTIRESGGKYLFSNH
jgi:4-amino-4-deoxy-L-arabinose transferase-like glycosyltransferase